MRKTIERFSDEELLEELTRRWHRDKNDHRNVALALIKLKDALTYWRRFSERKPHEGT